MAAGFKISADRGQEKEAFTVAASTAGSAGVEVNVDPAKFPSPHHLETTLERIIELLREGNYPPA